MPEDGDESANSTEGLPSFGVDEANLLAERAEVRARLIEVLSMSPAEIMAKAALVYLAKDPNTYKEVEDDRSSAHVEYLALQVLDVPSSNVEQIGHLRGLELTYEALGLVRRLFDIGHALLLRDVAEAHKADPSDVLAEYSFRTRVESLSVRMSGYPEHLARIIVGCFAPFDTECAKLLGFTGSQAVSLTDGVSRMLSARIGKRRSECGDSHDILVREVKRCRRGKQPYDGRFPEWMLKASWSEVERGISAISTAAVVADSQTLAWISSDELSEWTGVDSAACQSFLAAFSCAPADFDERYHRFPVGAHPVTMKPIMQIGPGYIVPSVSAIFDVIRPRLEDLIVADSKLWKRYLRWRGKYLEKESVSLLEQAIPGSRSWVGVKWKSSTEGSDLDGLVTSDDVTIRLQAKAGRLAASARRGAPDRMQTDIARLIGDAADQHRALSAAIESDGAAEIGLKAEQAKAMSSRIQVNAIVCLDDVTAWATEARELERLGPLAIGRDVPWILSLTDLMVVTDLLQGAMLVHYLLRRQRIERIGRVSAHDELDFVGNYIHQGLFFDRFFRGDDTYDRVHLTSQTDEIDAWYFKRAGYRTVATSKPDQPIPPLLGDLIRRLEAERPEHWIIAALALLDGDDSGRLFWNRALSTVGNRLRAQGWANMSAGCSETGLGQTVYLDRRLRWRDLRDEVTRYCERKAVQHKVPYWVGISEGRDKKLFISLVEKPVPPAIDEVFKSVGWSEDGGPPAG